MAAHGSILNRRNIPSASLLQGLDGGQSGQAAPSHEQRAFEDLLRQYSNYQQSMAGGQGTQSGPTQESNSAGWERFLQNAGGYGLSVGGGIAGLAASGGNPVAGGLGTIPGLAVSGNSAEYNPQDVWAHQAMQKMRRLNRGLPDE